MQTDNKESAWSRGDLGIGIPEAAHIHNTRSRESAHDNKLKYYIRTRMLSAQATPRGYLLIVTPAVDFVGNSV